MQGVTVDQVDLLSVESRRLRRALSAGSAATVSFAVSVPLTALSPGANLTATYQTWATQLKDNVIGGNFTLTLRRSAQRSGLTWLAQANATSVDVSPFAVVDLTPTGTPTRAPSSATKAATATATTSSGWPVYAQVLLAIAIFLLLLVAAVCATLFYRGRNKEKQGDMATGSTGWAGGKQREGSSFKNLIYSDRYSPGLGQDASTSRGGSWWKAFGRPAKGDEATDQPADVEHGFPAEGEESGVNGEGNPVPAGGRLRQGPSRSPSVHGLASPSPTRRTLLSLAEREADRNYSRLGRSGGSITASSNRRSTGSNGKRRSRRTRKGDDWESQGESLDTRQENPPTAISDIGAIDVTGDFDAR